MGKYVFRYGFAALLALTSLAFSDSASAQRRVVELSYTPTARAQIAIWVETGDGTFLRTFRLTDAVARRGIGNRPGAMQMNSGYHWPYGRREGVLPIWGHARLSADGAVPFRRVIFQDRLSEGFASRTSADASRDEFYCLSFNRDFSSKETLEAIDPTVDAMACPTTFNSDKGRYLTEADVTAGYAEPFENEMGEDTNMRVMDLTSLYPARRDLEDFGGDDHPDARLFFDETRDAMPTIDAVTMATPAGAERTRHQFTLPAEWANGDYVMYIEVNVEGDYHGSWGPAMYPTPNGESWDIWAETYGYAYRGQPTIVYAIPFRLDAFGGVYTTTDPEGYGEIHGMDGTIRPIDDSIANDPEGSPGSGADRLMLMDGGIRASLQVVPTNVCDGPMPPDACFEECTIDADCETGFVCHLNECLDRCNDAVVTAPSIVGELSAELDPDRTWEFVNLSFDAPSSDREIFSYEVRVARTPYESGTPFDEWGAQAKIAAAVEQALTIDPSLYSAGDAVDAKIGHLEPESTYYIGVRAVAECQAYGPVAMTTVETTQVEFATVSPCFVATATYGTPMAKEIGVLRRFRDRYLMNNAPGRALVEAYYEHGPDAADAIREDATLRAISLGVLDKVVAFADWMTE
ncbi:MAG: hypothetical protein JJ863_33985 [Deltaproteobacteria bacterium]|nr:hypothetical protein [Deltaproteobacteria bacterium]